MSSLKLTPGEVAEVGKGGHTPGPWEVMGGTQIGRMGEDWAHVAEVHNPRPTKNPEDSLSRGERAWIDNPRIFEAYANARLIAATPDLLKLLKEAREVLGWQLPDIHPLLLDIDKVIAKAESR